MLYACTSAAVVNIDVVIKFIKLIMGTYPRSEALSWFAFFVQKGSVWLRKYELQI
jgi:hypothetical protein